MNYKKLFLNILKQFLMTVLSALKEYVEKVMNRNLGT